MEEVPTHIIAVLFMAVVGVFIPGYYAMQTMAHGASDKRLAEQANKVAALVGSLEGPGSGARLGVQVPGESTLQLRPGEVSFEGRSANGSIGAPTLNSSLTLQEGTYSLDCEYTPDGVICAKK